MAQDFNDRATIRQYLLGELTDLERQNFEQRLMLDATVFEELLVAEDELVDSYLRGELDAGQKAGFESIFLATSERQDKLRFGRAFMNYVSSQTPKPLLAEVERPSAPWFQQLFASSGRIAVYAVLIVSVAVGSWLVFFRQSEVDKGLIALNDAYRQQRPIEARISRFDYAPFPVTRGAEPERVDSPALDRAERILLDAVHDNPGAQSYHALGKLYLARKEIDKAIAQFDQAVKANPNDAQIYADLGAAWLEKGKLSLDKGKANPASSEAGKGMEELGRSREYLSKALDHGVHPEALFNRALAEQYLMLYDQAEQTWREYLKLDSTSPWADEARRNLKLLEERKTRVAGTRKELIESFSKAYASQSDEAAWAALSPSRGRTGNAVVEALLDDVLSLAASGRGTEADEKQRMLAYAGRIEEQRVRDRFTVDVARVYGASTAAEREMLAQARQLIKSAIEVYNRSEYKQAIELFSKARELFAKTGDEGEALFAEAWVGYCHLRIPDPDTGLKIFERLSEIFEARNYRSLFAQSLLAIADASNGRNEYSKVLESARQSLIISEEIEDRANVMRCLHAGTTVHFILGNYRESLAAIVQALSLAERLPPDSKLTWPFYHEASIAFFLLGMPAVARQFEDEALRVALAAELPLQTSRPYDRLALIAERLQNYAEAIENSERARAEGAKIKDERIRTNILAHSALNFANLYRESGDPQRAIESYDQALALYQKINVDIYQYKAHKGKFLALLALQNNAAAEAELETVLYWFNQNREKIAEESYRNKFFDTDQNTYDLAVDFQYTRKQDFAKAFDYAEEYRARSLLDIMRTSAAVTGANDSPTIKLSTVTLPLNLTQIKSQLPKQAQLLEFAVLDDKVVMWVIARDKLESAYTTISRGDLDAKIKRYLRVVTKPGTNNNEEVISLGKELYASLISPIAGKLDGNLQLCIVPDDNLSFLPFAALISPTSGRYLVEDFALETAPSATIFINSSQQAEQRVANKTERLLVVGNPQFDREQFVDLSDLPGAAREAEAIARLYAAIPLLGKAASSSRVKQALGDADVVHFATHAIPDERSPLLSKLLLAKDSATDRVTHHAASGFLQASEIYGSKFPRTRLVVLSACQTGIERAYRGEGAIGLARPFIASGVPLVVASLWPVESEATADLMISFHRYRKQQHVSTVEALRRAQLEILHNQQPRSPVDHGWAAFVAIGGYATF